MTGTASSAAFYLKRLPAKGAVSKHWVGGEAADYSEFTLARCPGCDFAYDPIFVFDFDDPRLRTTALWAGKLLLMMCGRGCVGTDSGGKPRTWFDYRQPKEPAVVPGQNFQAGSATFEAFRRGPLAVVPDREVPLKQRGVKARLGGKPAFAEDSSRPPHDTACMKCKEPMTFLAQLTSAFDGTFTYPSLRYWFGCRSCRLVATMT